MNLRDKFRITQDEHGRPVVPSVTVAEVVALINAGIPPAAWPNVTTDDDEEDEQ